MELKSFLFNTFFPWIVALDFLNVLDFHAFLDLFSLVLLGVAFRIFL